MPRDKDRKLGALFAMMSLAFGPAPICRMCGGRHQTLESFLDCCAAHPDSKAYTEEEPTDAA